MERHDIVMKNKMHSSCTSILVRTHAFVLSGISRKTLIRQFDNVSSFVPLMCQKYTLVRVLLKIEWQSQNGKAASLTLVSFSAVLCIGATLGLNLLRSTCCVDREGSAGSFFVLQRRDSQSS